MPIKSLKLGFKMPKLPIPGLTDFLPEMSFEGTWERSDLDRSVGWAVYVQTVTRVAVVGLADDEGILREALNSYYRLFQETRDTLVKAGADLTERRGTVGISLAEILLFMLNGVLRPLLSKWHPRLLEHESRRPDGISTVAHEHAWSEAKLMRADMHTARTALVEYLRFLEQLCEIRHSLIPPVRPAPRPS
jgi:hypothetical protein